jgi:hypothetical protein
MPAMDLKKLGRHLSPAQASAYLRETYGLKRGTSRLAQLRGSGGGPRYLQIGRDVLYPTAFLDEWIGGIAQVRTHSPL